MTRYFVLLAILATVGAGCMTDAVRTNQQNEPAMRTSGSSLDLSDRGLSEIPSDVFSKTELQQLDVSGNRLTGAPQSQIGQLKNLTFLDLSDNMLTGLPAELGRLNKLETLDVSNNQLTGLPMELGNLTQLRLLDVSGNSYSKQDLDQIAAKLVNTEIRR